ncbi:charged multivesicular body protein 7 [Drosophila guanche]|uniref:Blast:Charged multivesicular body protein 7 n=1 Tax=Drosophila guanche TaxID=7266 RepID=A0A3B0KTV5_DROGU|nr:charged multivesicular body protein 7 [Drosophila guanche]SPP87338.1 blast:Charged multivesicular body protein 7 [Drosophila guanche]
MARGAEKSEFSFPACWEDSKVMQIRFATFRPRHLSIEDYDTKMKFWKDLVTQYLKFWGRVTFSLRDLQLNFMRGDQLPACLDTVISEMHQQKQIRPRTEYDNDPANTWSGWLMNSLVKRPLSWSWLKIKHSVVGEDMEASTLVEWIHLGVLNDICELMIKKLLPENRGKLFHFDAFKSLCDVHQIRIHTEKDIFACLISLHVRQLVGLEFKTEKQVRSIHLIKIPFKETDDLNINETDHAVHNLQITQADLLKQLENLEEEIKANDEKARQYIKENKRQMAKTYLRKRHLVEKNHERRSIALHNIESLLSSVDEAQNSGVVLDAYKIGSSTLQKVLSDSGLKYDSVDEVLADVRETLEQHREVQDVLSNSTVDPTASQEDDQLENELRELCGEAATVPQKSNAAASNNNDRFEVVISDQEMIEMLANLEVEDGSVSVSSTRTLKQLQKS